MSKPNNLRLAAFHTEGTQVQKPETSASQVRKGKGAAFIQSRLCKEGGARDRLAVAAQFNRT
jgi:hypothetical protein